MTEELELKNDFGGAAIRRPEPTLEQIKAREKKAKEIEEEEVLSNNDVLKKYPHAP
jgi:hypothetical protein